MAVTVRRRALGDQVRAIDVLGLTPGAPRTYVLAMTHPSGLTEDRLASLYVAEGFGGEKTMRAMVIRELIDEIRVLRSELLQFEPRPDLRGRTCDEGG